MKTPRLLAFGLLACGSALAAPAAPSSLNLKTQDRSVTVGVTDDNLSGPDIQLSFDDDADAVRGQAFGRPVNLTLENDTIRGTYGQGPVNVKVTDTNDTLDAVGTFGGKLTNFQVSPQQITGTVGACSYELLITRPHRYEGARTCGTKLDRSVSLTIPPSLADEDEELVTALSILLAQ
ncbi:hypothetical protein HUA74_28010 [Myxococcus sp. CA051A]|uniref:hypothetical protein n=1 Tax=unclassified Myxococcus TaxID=2648731 RepID=UPI00157A61A1|nr:MULTISPECIES: hypothetical protein [unclassified Myxococcus]NTX10047.1 hypothetical protein [Myxococcus sp. CA056]NTX40001.1 hypothetical protein [Myxococcus sp. CA033]NTX54239.1 hypothetical protein [Myxococcus sp. CA039A]NTX64508.1 hypothetical protein [Myxococcus sp. CA051A]